MSYPDDKLPPVRYVLYIHYGDTVVTNIVYRSPERAIDAMLSTDYAPHHGDERISEPQSRDEMIRELKNWHSVRFVDRNMNGGGLTTIVVEPTEYDDAAPN